MIDQNPIPPHEPAPPAAFCQNCGKPLDKDSMRSVGPSIYCEPCLAARIHGTYPGTNGPFTSTSWVNSAWPPSGIAPSVPNPGLATLLGFIPGVGAMYNEQYAKGLVHLIVFAILVSLVNASGIFVLFVIGWVIYMAFEAHHTAQARRDGTPLPNPFGLNDIGERFGFGRAWPGAPRPAASPAPGTPHAAQPGTPGWNTAPAPSQAAPETPGWGAPVDEYSYSASGQPAAYPPGPSTPAPDYAAYTRDYGSAASGYGSVPPVPPMPPSAAQTPPYGYGPYTAPPYYSTYVPPIPGDPNYVAPPSRFPAGAVWLIGLGTLFLLTTTGVFRGFAGGILVGFLLIGLGVWVFLRRMFESGAGLAANGSPDYGLRLMRATRGSVWLVLLGLLLLLNDFNILGWHRSWPLFIILAGVMALMERAAWTNASLPYTPPAPTSFVPHPDQPSPAASDPEKGGS